MADRDDTIRDLAAIIKAGLGWDHGIYADVDRLTSRLGLGEDDDVATVEAELRKALGVKASASTEQVVCACGAPIAKDEASANGWRGPDGDLWHEGGALHAPATEADLIAWRDAAIAGALAAHEVSRG
jgi:hypothetical protein